MAEPLAGEMHTYVFVDNQLALQYGDIYTDGLRDRACDSLRRAAARQQLELAPVIDLAIEHHGDILGAQFTLLRASAHVEPIPGDQTSV